MKTTMRCGLVTVVVLCATAASAQVTGFDFSTPGQVDEWHGQDRFEVIGGGISVGEEKPVWTCWSMVQDWEPYEKLVLTLEAKQDATLALAVSDDSEYTVAIPVKLVKGANTVELPVAKIFQAGLQPNYIRGIALWSTEKFGTITLKKVELAGKGVKLDALPRFGTRVLADAEGRDANFFWSYSYWARRVLAVEKHPSQGKRSYRMTFRGGRPVSGWGRFPHDWRGYESLVFDVHNPQDKPVSLVTEIKDAYCLFSKGYIHSRTDELPPGKNTTITIPLAGLAGKSGAAGAGRLNIRYIQQILYRLPRKEDSATLFVDNIRLTGKDGSPFEDALPADAVPAFGFEQHAKELKLPVDLHTLKVPEVEDAGKLKVGAARVKITPPVGIRMASVGSNSEGILDDIYVRVIVLQQEDRDQIVWMHIDNLYVPGRNEVPPILQERLGIKPENCFWSASHNHNSGAAWSNKQFNQQIIDAFVQGAEEARRNMKPVRVGIATTHAKFNYNRVMKGDDGKYYGMLDMKQNGFLMDSRPTDTQLAMLWFVDATDHPVACVLYYTGHPNMLCRVLPWISGDWSGWTERLLEDASGAVVMHVNGSLGDVDMRGNSISVDRCIRAGWDVAYTGMQATQQRLTAVDPSSMAGVRVLHAESRGSPNAKAAKKGVASHTLKVRTLTLGPIAFVDVGGELWSRFGLEIRSSSPFPYTYINFSAGYYYPEEWAFAQGSYGTKDRRPDWGGILRDTAVQLLKRAARE